MSSKKTELSPTLRTISLDEAIGDLAELNAAVHVIPDIAADDIATAIATLRRVCADLRVNNVEALLRNAGAVLKAATGLPSITAYLKSAQAEPLHQLRNVLGALAAAASLKNGVDLADVADWLPNLKERTAETNRPLRDDEIMLCRLDMSDTSLGSPKSLRSATTYVLCENGATPGESTTVTAHHLDDAHRPTAFAAAGNRLIDLRILAVSAFGQPILQACAAKELTRQQHTAAHAPNATDRPLTYTGAHLPGSAPATASPHRIIDRMLKRWQLKKDDITAGSLSLWAADVAYRRDGIDAACAITGRDADATAQALNLRIDTPVTTPEITSFLAA